MAMMIPVKTERTTVRICDSEILSVIGSFSEEVGWHMSVDSLFQS